MKKILSLTMVLAMLGTALTGCGSKDAAAKTPAESTRQTAPARQEQSQTEKALALINTFATGDTDTARSLLADGYIQHNLAYGTGADAFVGSVEYLATVYKGNIIKNLIMDCQSYTKYRPNETTGGIFVSWRRKEELPTGGLTEKLSLFFHAKKQEVNAYGR